jgi:hypothetical protein
MRRAEDPNIGSRASAKREAGSHSITSSALAKPHNLARIINPMQA